MDIKVGEYVRTTDGYIRKLENKDTTFYKYVLDIPYKNSVAVSEKKIKNHSKNIIKLIEVGDFINGVQVIEILPETFGRCYSIKLANNYIINFIERTKIKTILTKEQYESNCYEVVI